MNDFLKAVYKYHTYTENGAVSHATTGSALLDYFAKSGTYRGRELEKVFADISRIWADSPKIALQIIFYNRMITRQALGMFTSKKVQKGQGNRDEFRKGLIWLARYKGETLNKNLWLIPLVGTWKDLWHEDLVGELDRNAVYELVREGIEDPYNRDLLAKYLPRIRSKSNATNKRHLALNKFAFGLCKFMNWTPTEYRKFKASGNAHVFQRHMCNKDFDALNFNTIAGKALFNVVMKKGKMDGKTFLERHGIEAKYLKWIQSQPVAKFTGYVYELMKEVNVGMSFAQKFTVDKQFDGLIELAKKDQGGIRENVWCALDTSGSMTAPVANTTAFNICISLGVYFSTLNEGTFKDHVIMFDNQSRTKKISGSFSDKVLQILSETTAWGSTNFQSVIDEIVHVRRTNPNIPIEDFPTTLIVVSDMQFNPVGGNTQTNYEAAMQKLQAVGLPKIHIVWWWVTGRGDDFPSNMNDEGVTMIGGFDGAILSTLLGGDTEVEATSKGSNNIRTNPTPMENMLKALDQQVLKLLTI